VQQILCEFRCLSTLTLCSCFGFNRSQSELLLDDFDNASWAEALFQGVVWIVLSELHIVKLVNIWDPTWNFGNGRVIAFIVANFQLCWRCKLLWSFMFAVASDQVFGYEFGRILIIIPAMAIDFFPYWNQMHSKVIWSLLHEWKWNVLFVEFH